MRKTTATTRTAQRAPADGAGRPRVREILDRRGGMTGVRSSLGSRGPASAGTPMRLTGRDGIGAPPRAARGARRAASARWPPRRRPRAPASRGASVPAGALRGGRPARGALGRGARGGSAAGPAALLRGGLGAPRRARRPARARRRRLDAGGAHRPVPLAARAVALGDGGLALRERRVALALGLVGARRLGIAVADRLVAGRDHAGELGAGGVALRGRLVALARRPPRRPASSGCARRRRRRARAVTRSISAARRSRSASASSRSATARSTSRSAASRRDSASSRSFSAVDAVGLGWSRAAVASSRRAGRRDRARPPRGGAPGVALGATGGARRRAWRPTTSRATCISGARRPAGAGASRDAACRAGTAPGARQLDHQARPDLELRALHLPRALRPREGREPRLAVVRRPRLVLQQRDRRRRPPPAM